MDPDIPAPSIEGQDDNMHNPPGLASPTIQVNHHPSSFLNSAASIPLPPSSPMRPSTHAAPATPKPKSLSPKPPSRSPSVASSYRGDRQSTPTLTTRRSTSSLSTARGTTPHYPQYRRASSNLNPSSPAANGKMLPTTLPERPAVTASSVAKEYFGKELEAHASLQAPVVVIVHDACYGHRFSRPRSTKNALATIVERPERIHATLLGASAAYVRLGGRHAAGGHAPRPKHEPSYVHHVPFQIRKTARNVPLSHPAVAFVHGTKWMEELQVMCDTADGKLALNGKELVRPIGFGKDESGNPLPKLHEGDLYLCAESLAAFQGCLGGVCDAVDTVFSSALTRRAFVCIRPPGHHCSSNYPSGFCWLNNVHVGIAYAAMNHGLTHAAIIDFDLHHGDGSQNIAWAHNRKAQNVAKNAAQHRKTPIGYYSLHDINSYPCEWGDEEKIRNASLCIDNAHGQSIWNVHLESWNSPEEFWRLYETKYRIILDKARKFLREHSSKLRAAGGLQPRATIFISAGFDASEWEGAGMQRHSVNVPTEFYARFTAELVRLAHEDGLGVDGRIISVLEGGYSDRALTSGVLSHICGLAGDNIAMNGESTPTNGEHKFQTINDWVAQDAPLAANGDHFSYNTEWWAPHNLEELEAVVAGRQPPVSKTMKDKTGNYSSPTQASTLKMTDHARERQSFSALQTRLSLESEYVPPPPDVDWAIASYELSRVIIPGDRQTMSCTHEELNAQATKARKERQSTVGLHAGTEQPMQLRDRRTRPAASGLGAIRSSSRNGNRRTTIAAVSDLPDPNMELPELPNSRPRRRSSDASSILSSFQGMKLGEENNHGAPNRSTTPSTGVGSAQPLIGSEKQGARAIAVKKTRPPTGTKTVARPKTSPRKLKDVPPPLPASMGSGALKSEAQVAQGVTENAVKSSPSSQEPESTRASTEEIEDLASGMKKISIKLKLPTAEQHAARQQQKPDATDKPKKPRAPRKPPVPKPTTKVVKEDATSLASFAAIQPKQMPTEATKPFGMPRPAENAFQSNNSENVDSPGSTIDVSSRSNSQSMSDNIAPAMPPPPPSMMPLKAGMTPPDRPPPSAMMYYPGPAYGVPFANPAPPAAPSNTQIIPPVPPMRSEMPTTPVQQRTRQDLPVFTSTSPIPFANRSTPKEEQRGAANQQSAMWNIPESPR